MVDYTASFCAEKYYSVVFMTYNISLKFIMP